MYLIEVFFLLYFLLKITSKNGKITLIPADNTVLTSENGKDKWINSEVLGKYGCNPWFDMLVRPNER